MADLDPNEVLVSVDHPFGLVESTLAAWMRIGPGPRLPFWAGALLRLVPRLRVAAARCGPSPPGRAAPASHYR